LTPPGHQRCDPEIVLRNKERGTRNTGCFCLSFLFALFLLAGCSTPQPSSNQSLKRFGFNSTHMGTMFQITLYAPDEASARTAAQAAFVRVAALDEIMSDYQADSELMRLCDEPPGQPVRVSTDLFDILEQSQHFSELCNGAFDVTVGPFVRLWRLARKKKVLPTPAELSTAAASVGYRKYDLDRKKQTVTLLVPNMRLDLGGIAKGYAAEEALAVLKGRGLPRALVAASGDIAVGYPPPGQRGWKVAIAGMEPLKADKAGTVLLHNAGISTSGDAEQHIEIGGTRYSHILDPATGIGLTHPIQVTIIAPNATTTDALATGVSVMGLQRGLALVDSLPGTAALVLTRSDGKERVWASRRFKSIAVKE
jgi:thiamine biosynthesis lipoprotein